MNDFERCKHNHPSQRAKNERTIKAMEDGIDATAPEPTYHTSKRPGRRKPRGFSFLWR